ncbi:hypothetical protein E4P42_09705 [Mycobacterium sp. PS03-16]|uniref:hypothetical protein n=1 Tax=Mycobacterium sp. PS03-16 TaxID=2559611 RepID=UPI0010732E2D|nr:hypothetical protein [Mycobacterium sp. PS03-16]TFV59208.1 hypothetical protein E4P42_09705 [Mycobacterium sp. PS03-16]
MRVNRTTAPGSGVIHHLVTRAGDRLCVLVRPDGHRQLFEYDGDSDQPTRAVGLAPDEADQLADILHSRPITDRVAALEQRVDALIGERGR